ncbi:MAG TPA: transcriptional regulator [Geopsychrobacteraceae bacterium]|nr:transcriptional regulator [Geopsychrobacteraceae bacterium]
MSAKRGPGKPAKKYSQAARLHDVIRILEVRYGATIEELVEECEVTRRTVYRDLEAIVEAGYPLVNERQDDGTTLYRFVTGYKKLPPITFSLDELMTLYLCRGQLEFLHGTPFQDDLDAIFNRLRSSLPPRSVAHLERIAEAGAPRFQGYKDYTPKRQMLAELRQALLMQQQCRILYAPPRREAEEYLCDPYTLLFYKNALYLGLYAHNRKALRLFLIDRIESIEVLSERFEVPEDYNVDQLTGGAFGLIDEGPIRDVELLFAPQVAHLIRERFWHPRQTLEPQSDGSVKLCFSAAGDTEILSWIYSFIPHVKVLAPYSLKMQFSDALRESLNNAG